jgi:phage recombination protein Bet
MAKQNQVAKAAAPQQQVTATRASSLITKMALKYGVDPEKMLVTLKETCFKGGVTNEQMMALLVIASEYNLNPWTKEIYAFPDKNNGIVPVIGVDGWIRLVNERPEFVSMTFNYAEHDAGQIPDWIECKIVRKDRDEPIVVREYFEECKRNVGPWLSHPRRMLRHKALIQCARVAFGFGGVYDPDEAERIREAIDVTPSAPTPKPETAAPQALPGNTPALASDQQVDDIMTQLEKQGIPEQELFNHFDIEDFSALKFDQVEAALEWIAKVNG